MDIIKKYSPALQKEILVHFKELMRICVDEYDKRSLALVKKSFGFLMEHTEEAQEFNGIHLVKFSAG
ncbi:MAG: hypothetical protein KAI08_11645, partial [Bacteroidales bacterium]|nr:hypothetical protein [Bacteroidales bacterium]